MKSGTQLGLAVAAGYLLGRRRKMRLALMLAGGAATGGLGGVTGQVLRRGAKLVGSADVLGKLSPELGEMGEMISGELLPVGKAAARAAITSRINALSDQVHERAESLRYPGDEADEGDEDEGGQERAGRARGDESEDSADGERPARRPARGRSADRGSEGGDSDSRSAGRRPARRAADDEDEAGEDEGSGRPVRAASRRGGSPVRRAGR